MVSYGIVWYRMVWYPWNAWHAILLQECHGILDDLRRGELFHIVETAGASNMAIAVHKTTFTRMEPHHYHYDADSTRSWGCVLTVAKCTLAAPWASRNFPQEGHRHITFGVMHLHNISAKKPGVAPQLLRQVDEAMRTHQVDVLHGDINMATSLGYVSRVFDDLVYIHPNSQDILWGMPQQIGDCCGFVLRRTHWMVDNLVSKHGTWDFNYVPRGSRHRPCRHWLPLDELHPLPDVRLRPRRPPGHPGQAAPRRACQDKRLAQEGAPTGSDRRGQGVGHHVHQGQEHAVAQYQRSWEQHLPSCLVPRHLGNSTLT